MAISCWQDRSHRAEEHADVAVIGAGLAGAASAYWLAREGLGVTVIDRGAPGSGAAGRGLGVITATPLDPVAPWARPLPEGGWQRLCAASREGHGLLLGEVLGEEGHRAGFGERGAAWLAGDPGAETFLDRAASRWAAAGYTSPRVEAPDPGIWAPVAGVSAKGAAGRFTGLLDRDALALDPLRLVEVLLEGAARRGARILPHQEVFGLRAGPRGVEILAAELTLRADLAVICAGAGIDDLLPGGVPPRVRLHRGGELRAASAAPELPWPARWWPTGVGLRSLPEGGVLRETWRVAEAARGCSAPVVAVEAAGRRWGDVLARAPDGLPLLAGGPAERRFLLLDGAEDLFAVTFLAARHLAAWIVEGRSPPGLYREGRSG